MGDRREMIAVPRARVVVGLTADEAERIARELAAADEAAFEPGLGWGVFDVDAALARHRAAAVAAMPAHEVELAAYEIDIYPVTNAQWKRYVAEAKARPAAIDGPDDHFVTGISWQEASAYAHHYQLDLPSEAEWEHAARADRRLWPWGDALLPIGEIAFAPPADKPYAVGSRKKLASTIGVYDQVGMFGEYTRDAFAPYPGADAAAFARLFPGASGQRAVRGGFDHDQGASCVSRRGVPPDERRTHLKFRCVRRMV